MTDVLQTVPPKAQPGPVESAIEIGRRWTVGRRALRLAPAPQVRLLPALIRDWKRVSPNLAGTLDSLLSGSAPWPLLIYGPTGCGKTCAALAACDRAVSAAYWTSDGLCDRLLVPEGRELLLAHLVEKELVVVDELGARQKATELEYAAVKRVADEREAQAGRVAIYVSNLAPSALANYYDDRVASRLLCGTRFELTGKDRRFCQ